MTKAERTRAHLRATAMTLFAERGFDATTVQQIAEAAGVSHMTVFRHFPTKDDIVLDDPFDPLIAESVAAQRADLPPLARACRGLAAAFAEAGGGDGPELEAMRERIALVAGHPGLRARAAEANRATHEALVAALADGGAEALEAEAVAGAVLGALTSALLAGVPAGLGLDEVVRRALTALDPNLDTTGAQS